MEGGFPLTFISYEHVANVWLTQFKQFHHVQLVFLRPLEPSPIVTTEVRYTLGSGEFPVEVARVRLMRYRPALVNSTDPRQGEPVQHRDLLLARAPERKGTLKLSLDSRQAMNFLRVDMILYLEFPTTV